MLQFIKKVILKASGKLSWEASAVMSEASPLKKLRYDGRSKKRKWEERRSDYVAAANSEATTEEKKAKNQTFERIKRRKYVLLLSYSGASYFGMQRNCGCKTIEEDLMTGLFKANMITQEAFDQPQTIQFQRAARTDKGVSAIRQIVSLKLPETFNIDDINQYLPPEVRVFGAKRVTKGFNSKSQCDARTYAYMLPTIALSCSDATDNMEQYRLNSETLENVNRLLQNYLGTKCYHNFTSKKKPKDPSASRYMISFVCEPPFVRKNVEFAVMKVKGQSFMMHQIRKMVGLVIAISRGYVKEDIFQKAFSLEKLNIPRAPGLGLMLEFVHYDRYNKRYGADGVHDKLLWEEEEATVNAFAHEHIFPTIIDTEVNEKPMLVWLQKLSRHKFDSPVEEEEANDEEHEDEEDEHNENVCKEEDENQAEIDDLKRQSSVQ